MAAVKIAADKEGVRLRLKKSLSFWHIAALLLVLFAGFSFYAKAVRSVPVLNYHQINDTEKNSLTINSEQFAAQMKYLKDAGYTTITISDMLAAWNGQGTLPDKPIIITFDDGYKDNLRHAFPILEQYGFKATVFVVTDYVNTYPNYLSWEDALAMQQSGLIEIESHTLSHQDLTKSSSEEAIRWQLNGSRQALKWHLKKDARYLAYPAGAYDKKVLRLVEDMGYKAAFTVHYGLCDPENSNPYALSRITVFGSVSHTLFRFKLRLWFAPVIEPLNDIRLIMQANGLNLLSELVPVP